MAAGVLEKSYNGAREHEPGNMRREARAEKRELQNHGRANKKTGPAVKADPVR